MGVKKYGDWDKVEEEVNPGTETCECTRTKVQFLINSIARVFGKGKEASACDAPTTCCNEPDADAQETAVISQCSCAEDGDESRSCS